MITRSTPLGFQYGFFSSAKRPETLLQELPLFADLRGLKIIERRTDHGVSGTKASLRPHAESARQR
jgi:hypothetical protein